MKTKIALMYLIALVTGTVALTGCTTGNVTDEKGEPIWVETSVFTKNLPNGKTVMCIAAQDTGDGGTSIDCDWAHTTVDIGEGNEH
jgi:hypothetical protein